MFISQMELELLAGGGAAGAVAAPEVISELVGTVAAGALPLRRNSSRMPAKPEETAAMSMNTVPNRGLAWLEPAAAVTAAAVAAESMVVVLIT